MTAVKHLINFPTHYSTLYKDAKNGKYYLTITANNIQRHISIFVHGMLSEYGKEIQCKTNRVNFFNEHYDILIKDDAVNVLRNI
jgi:adapter protein MecA 1/2